MTRKGRATPESIAAHQARRRAEMENCADPDEGEDGLTKDQVYDQFKRLSDPGKYTIPDELKPKPRLVK